MRQKLYFEHFVANGRKFYILFRSAIYKTGLPRKSNVIRIVFLKKCPRRLGELTLFYNFNSHFVHRSFNEFYNKHPLWIKK